MANSCPQKNHCFFHDFGKQKSHFGLLNRICRFLKFSPRIALPFKPNGKEKQGVANTEALPTYGCVIHMRYMCVCIYIYVYMFVYIYVEVWRFVYVFYCL
jgi:hypothetical protein